MNKIWKKLRDIIDSNLKKDSEILINFSMNSSDTTEWSFDGQLCLEFLYQTLLKSDNPSSSYDQRNFGVFFMPRSIYCNVAYS